MPAQVRITALYRGSAEETFESALDFREMTEAMKGLASYEGLPATKPEEGATFSVDVTLWGFLKTSGHVMHIEKLDRENRVLQSREHNPAIRQWDHHLTVVQDGPDEVRWVDTIMVDAGWRTPFVARFCAHVYQRRHKRRRALDIATQIGKA